MGQFKSLCMQTHLICHVSSGNVDWRMLFRPWDTVGWEDTDCPGRSRRGASQSVEWWKQ